MSMMSEWTYDAPTGVYKNHALSSEMRRAAIAQCVGMQFVRTEPGYGKNAGENLTIARASNLSLPTSGQLVEATGIPVDKLTLSTTSITVAEWGRALEFTSKMKDLSKYDIEQVHKDALQDQMKLVIDKAIFAAFKTAKLTYAPTGVATYSLGTAGAALNTATANLNFYHLETIRDLLAVGYNVPPAIGDDWIGLVSTKGCRGIKNDPKFEAWNTYTNREAKLTGEIGRIESIRIVEVRNTNSLSGSLGSGGVLGEAVFFGADAVAMIVAQDPELRMAIPSDFGRKHAIAWYGMLNFGLIWDTANAGEARVIHVSSL